MTNNYVQFVVEFPFPEQAAWDFMSLCDGNFYNYPQWFVDKHGLTEDNPGEFKDDLGVITEYDNGKLYIASEVSGDINGVAYMLSKVMEQYDIRKAVVIEAAFTCSKIRIGGFGGTVVVIGPGIYKLNSTTSIGEKMAEEMRKEIVG